MAVGDITQTQQTKSIKLLEAATAANGVPIGTPTAGVSVGELLKGAAPADAVVFIASTAGSGAMTATFKVWGFSTAAGAWAPLGVDATAASRGLLNGGSAVDEVSTDAIRHTEPLACAWAFDRLYLEITAIGGTATAVSAWLVVPATVA